MKRILIITTLFLSTTSALKAQTIKIFYEVKAMGYIIYASSNELYPVSISLDMQLSNLTFSEGEKKVFVLPPKSEKFKIGEFSAIDRGHGYKFSYKYISTLGDVTITHYDNSFDYDLPFQKGKSYNVYQGYHGAFSHQDENSLDFVMPEGTEVFAARGGIVVQVVQNNSESCSTEECKKYNNYITVMHSDGSFATYAHIKYHGSIYILGDSVKRGEAIAYSGNVGWSTGPHLHFVCFLGAFGKWNTLATKFRIDKGAESIFLKERNTYLRDY
ncbi:MAG: Peptidase [Ferruginibacter sp.]|nr:Peptidase [Ferruginibacter sp.]